MSNSLFSIFINNHGLKEVKGGTRDLICLDFDFGSRSYEEEMQHLNDLSNNANDDESKIKILEIIKNVENNKNLYVKHSKDEIRDIYYENNVEIVYEKCNKSGDLVSNTITYKMLYRNSSKAKLGQVMFINEELYDVAYDWLTMGLGSKMHYDNAKIVEMSAYAPLTTSTIVDTLHIPVNDILILEDRDSYFRTRANVVRAEEYDGYDRIIDEEMTLIAKNKAIEKNNIDVNGNPIYRNVYKKIQVKKKKCVVSEEEIKVKNTVWDGMGIIDSSVMPKSANGMVLLRNHFFKMCGFKSNIQDFFKDYCVEKEIDYTTYQVQDMFGRWHYAKDVKVITTDNAIKWKKFVDIMGGTLPSAYEYWCGRVNKDGSLFGIVKTDHESKLGSVQQLSYQMINTLPCNKTDVSEIAKDSIAYVELLKTNNDVFEQFLRKNSNEVNHYAMLADMYSHNNDFADSRWFRKEKRKIINEYVCKLRSGKITVNGDNLTICGNPYALLLYTVGENWESDPTLLHEDGTIQCYTTRFNDGEYLGAFRSPHNSPNNICYLHNHYSPELNKYFPFSKNIIAVNCIGTDIQDRGNGLDEDSDFFLVTNNPTFIKYAKLCYKEYPTIVNMLNESGLTYKNSPLEYSRMDNKFSLSKRGIGESSNLAQLALTYYWTKNSRELYENFIILSVLAQVIIDGCKREYEVDALTEIERIKSMDCMQRFICVDGKKIKRDLPVFMKYTKDIPTMKNGNSLPYDEIRSSREKVENRIDHNLICPMNYLQECLSEIQGASRRNTIDTSEFFIKYKGHASIRQMTKIRSLVENYDNFVKVNNYKFSDDDFVNKFKEKSDVFMNEIKKIKIGNIVTINRLVETALSLDLENNNPRHVRSLGSKYSRRMLNTLYKTNKDKFLMNFVKGV